jgi:uncharacterized paraquat-inducible protein A
MAAVSCPRCATVVEQVEGVPLQCPTCGYPGADQRWSPNQPPAAPAQPFGQTAGVMAGGGPMCPRCRSTYTKAGGIPTWAIVATIVGFFFVCVLSLFFLMVKDEHQCYNCGLRWK